MKKTAVLFIASVITAAALTLTAFAGEVVFIRDYDVFLTNPDGCVFVAPGYGANAQEAAALSGLSSAEELSEELGDSVIFFSTDGGAAFYLTVSDASGLETPDPNGDMSFWTDEETVDFGYRYLNPFGGEPGTVRETEEGCRFYCADLPVENRGSTVFCSSYLKDGVIYTFSAKTDGGSATPGLEKAYYGLLDSFSVTAAGPGTAGETAEPGDYAYSAPGLMIILISAGSAVLFLILPAVVITVAVTRAKKRKKAAAQSGPACGGSETASDPDAENNPDDRMDKGDFT